MGLAPYGNPIYQKLILRSVNGSRLWIGSFWLERGVFQLLPRPNDDESSFSKLFGGPPRKPESPLDQRHMDLAASIQAVAEEVVLRIGRHVHRAKLV